ncbi:hypothetical protein [Lacticaseibacillus parakribbianus]|uniref:hypothetical protein n=1 Tax=Lacticaseibacillus parakribbianus TaxID=2970927 RepID=UPI0021CB41CC|nr:hypothetical protein [Lacticaseibacillus parakribbianus]
MLDERLIGDTFTLPETGDVVCLYGIHYHYLVLDGSRPGDLVVIVGVTPLALRVRNAERDLQY